jgi:acyl carrier protein
METGAMAQTQSERELAGMIVEVLNLAGVQAADIVPDAPLFGEGLGLDSIDALEIAVAVAQRYGVQLRAEDEATKRIFANLRNLAQHIDSNRVPAAGT